MADFVPHSEATQCVTLFSRQGTTDTIEEVEDEQERSGDKQQVTSESQQLEESAGASPWGDEEHREKEQVQAEGQDALVEAEWPGSTEETKDWETDEGAWEPFVPDQDPAEAPEESGEGPSLRAEDVEISVVTSADEKGFITESEDGTGQRDYMHSQGCAGLVYTPDTDASKTSDAEVPPSYSKAVSFDRLEVSDDESDMDRKRLMVMTPDSQSDCSRSDLVLPSMTTELTASELLLNK